MKFTTTIRIVVYVAMCFAPLIAFTQVAPSEASHLNHTLIGFSFGNRNQRQAVDFEIARGYQSSDILFKQNIFTVLSAKGNRLIYDVPAFGEEYTWRTMDRKTGARSAFHHFSTDSFPYADTALRLRIMQQPKGHNNAYVLLDGYGCMFDIHGKPVWFLPHRDTYSGNLRDLKVTPVGTFTFLSGNEAYAVDYNGNVLWTTPVDSNGLPVSQFHHQVSRLQNGHYMVLGNDNAYVWRDKINCSNCIKEHILADDDTVYRRVQFGNLLEYDQTGKLVWEWRSLDYVQHSDLCFWTTPTGVYFMDFHLNSFFVNELNGCIYLSFRNVNRVLKISYPGGKELQCYGERFTPLQPPINSGLFYGQHSCFVTSDGLLGLFNNNMHDTSCLPEVLLLKESGKDSLTPVWKFNCTVNGISDRDIQSAKREFNDYLQPGGSVAELRDSCLFISMSMPLSKLYIVNRAKEVIWEALPEEWDPVLRTWRPTGVYKASLIDEDVAQLTWGEK